MFEWLLLLCCCCLSLSGGRSCFKDPVLWWFLDDLVSCWLPGEEKHKLKLSEHFESWTLVLADSAFALQYNSDMIYIRLSPHVWVTAVAVLLLSQPVWRQVMFQRPGAVMISWWSGKLLIARWRETQIEIVWAFWSLNFSIGRQRCISDMIYIRLSPHVWVTAVAVLLLSQPAWRQVMLLIARWRETQIEIVWAFWILNFGIGRQRCISDMIYIRLSPHVWVTAVAVLLLSQPVWRQVMFQRPGASRCCWINLPVVEKNRFKLHGKISHGNSPPLKYSNQNFPDICHRSALPNRASLIVIYCHGASLSFWIRFDMIGSRHPNSSPTATALPTT